MKISWVFIAINWAILSSCASAPIVPFPPDPSLPAEWGSYVTHNSRFGPCPDLKGTFSTPTRKILINKSERNFVYSGFADYFGLFPWSLAERLPGRKLNEKPDHDLVRVETVSESILRIELILVNDVDSHRYKFNQMEGDFHCENGVLGFPSHESYGGLEGRTVNGQSRVSVGVASDGALVFLRTQGVLRASNANYKNDFRHEYFRFEPTIQID